MGELCEMIFSASGASCGGAAVASTSDGVRVCRQCADELTAEADPDVWVVVPCGGCGAQFSRERCIGCLHDFGDPGSAWVRLRFPVRVVPRG